MLDDDLWQAPELGDRFDIRRRLGAGGMGVVYEAYDRARGGFVALKFMVNVDPIALFRFKNEFRVLADLQHKNLVQLYELWSVEQQCFFTMELVRGGDFLDWVRPGVEDEGPSTPERGRGSPREPNTDSPPTVPSPNAASRVLRARSRRGDLDPARVRPALRQLAEGLAALHRHERLHLDIKPSNILVEDDGRVAICDFGLTRRLASAVERGDAEHVAGTISHMSPEQAGGGPVSEASDWYSVGVVLYQCLTGQLPFVGDHRDVLLKKQVFEAVPPRDLVSDAPEDLARLCAGLLRMKPEDRPGADEVLGALGVSPRHRRGTRATVSTRGQRFVGRALELDVLGAAFDAARGGEAHAVLISGASGSGKSALMNHFAALARERGALVLAGRCYEGESLPFKAFDAVVDALSSHLVDLPTGTVDALVPRDVAALARLFPVLRRVRSIAAPPTPSLPARDPQESRRRAFIALRELLGALARERPLVLAVDDLHWGDQDSGVLLRELLARPGAPPLLLLGTLRPDEAGRSPLFAALREGGDLPAHVQTLELPPLSDAEAADLARALLPARADLAVEIAREAGGSPFFVTELVRHAESAEDDERPSLALRVDDVVAARVAPLSAPARALLTAIAVAGRPVALEVALRAARVPEADRRAVVATLRVDHLARVLGQRRSDEELETYHDRVRESVRALLGPAEIADWHHRLAMAHEDAGNADPEILLDHWYAAGDHARAAAYAVAAATRATEAMAFDRSVSLLRLAQDFTPADAGDDERRPRRVALAEALASAGRGAEAAEEYIAAARGAPAADALELRRRAAVQWLYMGHFDRGLDAIRAVLADAGLHLATTPRRALVSLVTRRALVRLRGFAWKERDKTQISPEQLSRVDILWSVATGLSMIDTIRGADFQARHLRLSLRLGEPGRVARSLAMEAAYAATAGVRGAERAAKLLAEATRLADRHADPVISGFVQLVTGVAAFLRSDWPVALDHCLRAEQTFRDHGVGVSWELTNAQVYALSAMAYTGDLPRLAAQLPDRVREALERGNLYMINWLGAGVAVYLWLANDEAARAQEEVEAAREKWSHPGFHVQHYFIMWSLCQVALYRGETTRSLELVEAQWGPLRRSLLLRVQYVRVQALHLRARCMLAAAGGGQSDEAKRQRAQAHKAARRLCGEGTECALGLGQSVLAAVAAQRGERAEAVLLLGEAEATFRRASMGLFAACAAYQRARLADDAEAQAAANLGLRRLSVKRPERMSEALITGIAAVLSAANPL